MKKVTIIGAGPAGLTAGYKLQKTGRYDVTILEAEDAVGGISKTINYKGNRMDLGGHRFFSKDTEVINFWNDMLPLQGEPSFDDKKLNRQKNLASEGPNPDKEDKVMLKRNRVSRIYYKKKFFDYPVTLNMKTIKNLGFIDTTKSGFSYLKSLMFKKKEDSLENFYINRFGKKLYQTFFEKYTEKLWGRHPSKISADWGAQRVKGISILAIIKDVLSKIFKKKNRKVETSLIEEYTYPKFGPGQMWETVAAKFEELGGKIIKNATVEELFVENGVVKKVTYSKEGRNNDISADYIISSMPIKDLINGTHDENLSAEVKKYAAELPYRDFMTVGLLVKKLKLNNETNIKTLGNIVPDCWIYVQEPNVELGRIQIFNNWSPYLVKNIEDTVWIGLEYFCNEGDKYWNMTDEEFATFAIDELTKIKVIEKEDVLDYTRIKVKKAYPAYFDSYANINDIIKYLDSIKNLYCIGRNGQHRYNNMDHSMMTAFEAVKNIENKIESRENIWNVNTEKEYHEVKEKTNERKVV